MSRLFISFSGGRTSAYMTKRLLKTWGGETIVLFANTGREHEETLRFINRCDQEYGFGTIWLESVVHPQRGVGTSHRVVTFETASRQGEPFEAAIQKFGIPNKHFPHCTRELKQRPMFSYLRSIGWQPKSYQIALGIRADEIDRMSVNADRDGIIYPLVNWGVKKPEILKWWKAQPFDLYLPEHLGNCDFCWKKSLRKHLTLAADHPEVFDFPRRMESLYPYNGPGTHDGPRHFFYGNKSAEDILRMSREPFERFEDANQTFDPELDMANGCSESCEIDYRGEAA